MLPPVLEIYVVWHPDDRDGAPVADQIMEHFRGSAFTGLIGCAVEVYARSQGWRGRGDAPRPIPFPDVPPPNGLAGAELVAVVPVLGPTLAAAVQAGAGPWHRYTKGIVRHRSTHPGRVGVFPVLLDEGAVEDTELGRILGRYQRVGHGPPVPDATATRCRDLAQGIAQMAGEPRLTVFVSYTRHAAGEGAAQVADLIERVERLIGRTRLGRFIDTNDLQPGSLWEEDLYGAAETSALLAVRTDLYARRHYTQGEMLRAKRRGVPVVMLDALLRGEERGSFLMDHVPRVPVRPTPGGWSEPDIARGLNLLVDECLKGVLWRRQRDLARDRADLRVDWWAPHAPEPVTLAAWLAERGARGGDTLRILHPDPPLDVNETRVLDQMAALAGIRDGLQVMTPRQLAARGG